MILEINIISKNLPPSEMSCSVIRQAGVCRHNLAGGWADSPRQENHEPRDVHYQLPRIQVLFGKYYVKELLKLNDSSTVVWNIS